MDISEKMICLGRTLLNFTSNVKCFWYAYILFLFIKLIICKPLFYKNLIKNVKKLCTHEKKSDIILNVGRMREHNSFNKNKFTYLKCVLLLFKWC